MHACARTLQSALSTNEVLNISHPTALRGWLHKLLHWGFPWFTAHNCLPFHRRCLCKYDSLILMCLGTHNPNTNAALHAWANDCRCHLIISSTCSLSWSVNSGTISSSPLCPSTDRCSFDWWRLHRSQFLCCWSCIFTEAHCVLKKDNTCPVFNGNFVLGGLFGMHMQWLCGKKMGKIF